MSLWPRLINLLLGLWLMAAPAVLGYDGAAANNDRIVGPIIASFATIAIWEATRGVAHANLVLGLWLIVAPWLLGFPTDALIHSTAVGVAVAALSLLGRGAPERYGGGWSALWRSTPSVPRDHA